MSRITDELLISLELITIFGVGGLLCETEPFYPDGWQQSDSACYWSWQRLGQQTECIWWAKLKR